MQKAGFRSAILAANNKVGDQSVWMQTGFLMIRLIVLLWAVSQESLLLCI